jgi:transcriptional regulator with XRE-family HTH domain
VARLIRFLGYDPEPNFGSLASRVLARRRSLGLSQAELAAQLGLDEGTISDIEGGRRRSSRRVAAAVERFLDRSGTR